ncbi:MAG: hypothetical protein AAF998_14130 [Bacteroidota bacterium]
MPILSAIPLRGWTASRGYLLGHALLFAGFIAVLIRTAWTCDDAFISHTCAVNLAEGHGLTFQPFARVQAFSNPLWTLIMAGLYPLSGETWRTGMVLGIVLSALVWWWLLRRGRNWDTRSLVAGGILLLSSSFIDFSTSGLENSLSHLLILGFATQFLRPPADRRWLTRLFLLGSLALLCRLDLIWVVGPAMLVGYRQVEARGKWKSALLGLLPILGWEAFSLIYYGFFLPNTWYAKLGTGEGRWFLLGKGWIYFWDTLRDDPLTVLVIVGGGLQVGRWGNGRSRWLLIGAGLYVLAVVAAGGDFMRGRMFTVPFVLLLFLWLRTPAPAWWPVGAGALLVLGLLRADAPLYSGPDYHLGRTERPWERYANNITDERAMYWNRAGWRAHHGAEVHPAREFEAEAARQRAAWDRHEPVTRAVVAGSMGKTGYLRARGTQIIDFNGLADPLLARFPALDTDWWRAGHRPRYLDPNHERIVAGESIQFADPGVQAYWQRLRVVTAGPLWSGERWRTIWGFLTGEYRHLLNRERLRYGMQDVRPAAQGSYTARNWQAICFRWDRPVDLRAVEFTCSIAQQGRIELEWRRGGMAYGRIRLRPYDKARGRYRVELPDALRERGVDALAVYNRHLIPRMEITEFEEK